MPSRLTTLARFSVPSLTHSGRDAIDVRVIAIYGISSSRRIRCVALLGLDIQFPRQSRIFVGIFANESRQLFGTAAHRFKRGLQQLLTNRGIKQRVADLAVEARNDCGGSALR